MFQSKKANFALSLILAAVLWVYVVGELNPETRRVFRNVPITIMNEQTLADDGLAVVSTSESKMNITLTGKRNQINRISAYDITATVDVSEAAEGNNQLRINIKVPNNVYIEDQSINRVTVTVEGSTEENKPVTVLYTGNVGPGLEATTVSVDPEEVAVSGAKSQVKKVVSVQAEIDVGEITETESSVSANLIPINKNGKEVSNVSLSTSKATVTSVLYYTKIVGLDVPVTGKNSGGYTRTYTCPNSIKIKGPQDIVDGIETVRAKTIDLSSVTSNTSIHIEPIMAENVTVSSGASSLYMKVKVKENETQTETDMKKFNFSGSDVSLENVPEELSASSATEGITVTVSGTADDLKTIGKDDISLSADLSGLDAGTQNVVLNVSCSGNYSNLFADPQEIEVTLE